MKLLILDLEGTLFETYRLPSASIESTIWQTIARALGDNAVREEMETQRRWDRKDYRNYLEWMKDTISIHIRHGLTSETFNSLISSAKYNQNVVETISKINRAKYEPILVSGGFRELAARAQRDLNIEHAFAACEYLFGHDGKLLAYNLLPCDFQGKVDFVRMMLRAYGLGSHDWIFVGDGKNDVNIAKVAPISVGYRPHQDLRGVVTHVIDDFQELLTIL